MNVAILVMTLCLIANSLALLAINSVVKDIPVMSFHSLSRKRFISSNRCWIWYKHNNRFRCASPSPNEDYYASGSTFQAMMHNADKEIVRRSRINNIWNVKKS